MARKRPAPKYAGALAQPIYVDEDQIDRVEEVLLARVPEKIHLLFKHYKIDPSDEQSWQTLALQLALDHVPGVRLAFRPKRGPHPTWKAGLGFDLVRAVQCEVPNGHAHSRCYPQVAKGQAWDVGTLYLRKPRYTLPGSKASPGTVS